MRGCVVCMCNGKVDMCWGGGGGVRPLDEEAAAGFGRRVETAVTPLH
jgi:hypothetical protein